jgi:hypothetical protein
MPSFKAKSDPYQHALAWKNIEDTDRRWPRRLHLRWLESNGYTYIGVRIADSNCEPPDAWEGRSGVSTIIVEAYRKALMNAIRDQSERIMADFRASIRREMVTACDAASTEAAKILDACGALLGSGDLVFLKAGLVKDDNK